jgi:hypothetical protein
VAGRFPYRRFRRGGSNPAGGSFLPADAAALGLLCAGGPELPGQRTPDQRPAVIGRGLRVASSAGARVRRLGRGARVGLAVVTERLLEMAPRIPVRDLETLRRQYPGLDAEQIADRLVSAATWGSGTVGAGVGAAAALPVPPAIAIELATETLAVAAVEIKLIAELHEVYGLRAPGNVRQRAYAYVGSWADRRGVDVLERGTLTSAFSGGLKRELRQRLMRRSLRHLPSLTPFLIGAAIGGAVNRRDTHRLAERIRADLRRRAVAWDETGTPPPDPADSPRPDGRELPGPG